jgi:hypothetical protein
MKYRLLAAFPLVFAAVFALAALVTGDPFATITALRAENEAGKVVALLGSFVAALAFGRNDYLRRAWFYGGLCYLLLLISDTADWSRVAGALPDRRLELAQGTLAFIANAASVLSTGMLARAWSVAGLDEGAGRRRIGVLVGATVLSLAITGWPLAHDVSALARGDLGAAPAIASDLGDTVCLALVAPVMQTALAMRGGLLRWPWGLLTASGAAWIVYDGLSGIVEALDLRGAPWLVATETWRGLACAAVFSAGVAQRWALAPGERPTIPPET